MRPGQSCCVCAYAAAALRDSGWRAGPRLAHAGSPRHVRATYGAPDTSGRVGHTGSHAFGQQMGGSSPSGALGVAWQWGGCPGMGVCMRHWGPWSTPSSSFLTYSVWGDLSYLRNVCFSTLTGRYYMWGFLELDLSHFV